MNVAGSFSISFERDDRHLGLYITYLIDLDTLETYFYKHENYKKVDNYLKEVLGLNEIQTYSGPRAGPRAGPIAGPEGGPEALIVPDIVQRIMEHDILRIQRLEYEIKIFKAKNISDEYPREFWISNFSIQKKLSEEEIENLFGGIKNAGNK